MSTDISQDEMREGAIYALTRGKLPNQINLPQPRNPEIINSKNTPVHVNIVLS